MEKKVAIITGASSGIGEALAYQFGKEGFRLSITGTNSFVDINEEINSFDDHRIAMSFLIAGIRSKNGIRVKNCKNIETSFPHFKDIMNSLGMKSNEKD